MLSNSSDLYAREKLNETLFDMCDLKDLFKNIIKVISNSYVTRRATLRVLTAVCRRLCSTASA